MFLNINACDFCQSFCRILIHRRTCGRTEHQRIRQDGRTHKPSHFGVDFHLIFQIHQIYDGGSTANGLVTEIYGHGCFQCTQTMMVDDFQNFRFVNAVNSLGFFVMVYHDDFFVVHFQQGTSGQHTDIIAFSIQHREITMADFCHGAADIADKIIFAECNQVFFPHEVAQRGTLADESCCHIRIMRCADDGAVVFLCQFLNGFGNRGTHTDNDTACVHFHSTELRFKTVPCDQNIAGFHISFQQVRVCRTNKDFPFLRNHFFGITHYHSTVNGIQNIGIFCFGHCQNSGFINIHVGCGNIFDRNDTFQFAFVYDRHGRFLHISHSNPCVFQRHFFGQAGCDLNGHVFYLCTHMVDECGAFYTKKVQYILGFVADFPSSFGYIITVGNFIFQICVCDGRANRVCVRILMSDDKHIFFSCHLLIAPFFSSEYKKTPKASKTNVFPYFQAS